MLVVLFTRELTCDTPCSSTTVDENTDKLKVCRWCEVVRGGWRVSVFEAGDIVSNGGRGLAACALHERTHV